MSNRSYAQRPKELAAAGSDRSTTRSLVPFRPGQPLSPERVLHLQRTAGNKAVSGLLERKPFEGLESALESAVGAVAASEERSPVHDVVGHRGGRPLQPALRANLEGRLGQDLSSVRVHSDAVSAESVGAKAYTVGDDIVVHPGQVSLGTSSGDRVLAHETAHVVQQRSGPVDGSRAPEGIKVSDPSDRFEREADIFATSSATLSGQQGTLGYRSHGSNPAGEQPVQRAILDQGASLEAARRALADEASPAPRPGLYHRVAHRVGKLFGRERTTRAHRMQAEHAKAEAPSQRVDETLAQSVTMAKDFVAEMRKIPLWRAGHTAGANLAAARLDDIQIKLLEAKDGIEGAQFDLDETERRGGGKEKGKKSAGQERYGPAIEAIGSAETQIEADQEAINLLRNGTPEGVSEYSSWFDALILTKTHSEIQNQQANTFLRGTGGLPGTSGLGKLAREFMEPNLSQLTGALLSVSNSIPRANRIERLDLRDAPPTWLEQAVNRLLAVMRLHAFPPDASNVVGNLKLAGILKPALQHADERAGQEGQRNLLNLILLNQTIVKRLTELYGEVGYRGQDTLKDAGLSRRAIAMFGATMLFTTAGAGKSIHSSYTELSKACISEMQSTATAAGTFMSRVISTIGQAAKAGNDAA